MIAKFAPINVVEIQEESIPLKENDGDIKKCPRIRRRSNLKAD